MFDAVKAGDALALALWMNSDDIWRAALAVVAVVVDPAVFVIGGGVSKAGGILRTYVEKEFRKRAFFANKDTQIAIATLEMMQESVELQN